jgi:hypothetical protein
MRLATAMGVATTLVLGFACNTEVGETGGGGADCNPDDWQAPECCSVPDHRPCKGLSLADCKARAYCYAVEGTPWDDHSVPETYLGCMSPCTTLNTAETCLYNPADPATCHWDHSGEIPDGWVELPDCIIPAGMCGQ